MKLFSVVVLVAALFAVCATALSEPTVTGNALECASCKAAVKLVRHYYSTNSSIPYVVEKISTMCNLLPVDSYKEMCISAAQIYVPEFIEDIAKMDDAEICQKVKLCDAAASTPLRQERAAALVPLVSRWIAAEEGQQLTGETCAQCSASVALLQDFLTTYGADSELATYVKTLSPHAACAGANMCVAPKVIAVRPAMPTKAADKDYPYCAICMYIETQIEVQLQQNATEEQIKTFLDNVCTKIPDAYVDQCVALVDANIDAFIGYIVNKLPPAFVCASIDLCPAPEARMVPLARAAPVKVPIVAESKIVAKGDDYQYCAVCQYIATQIETQIQQNATEAQIQDALDNLCSYLPQEYVDQCTNVIDGNLDAIIAWLVNNYPPAFICQGLDLCPAPDARFSTPMPAVMVKEPMRL